MKKRGFTLIELMAIIILIGVMGLIIVPGIVDVINKSNKKAFDATIEGYIKAIKTDNIKRGGQQNKYYIKNGDLFHTDTNEKIKIENNSKEEGVLITDSDGNIKGNIENDDYCSIISNGFKESLSKNNECLLYSDPILNGTDPVLDSGMIPVVVENNGTTKKADISSDWYDYSEKKWANIVIVNNESYENYKNISSGSLIKKEDILAHFVWIPRYKYLIPTGGTNIPSTIDIVFEDKYTEKSTGNAKTEYFTHPAFTFGKNDVNGIWFGKFETSGSSSSPTILPNVKSLGLLSNSNQFKSAQFFNSYFSNGNSHMTKNSEWAAAAYLSQSLYGLNDKIRINNNNIVLTGCGAQIENDVSVTTCDIAYGDASNYPQSTSGNITGIFDMSGGLYERVMANYNNKLANSGFTSMPESKYYDLYTTDSILTACNGDVCLGHALNETKGWDSGYFAFLNETNPWPFRGGGYNDKNFANFNYINDSIGNSYGTHGFRIAIVIE